MVTIVYIRGLWHKSSDFPNNTDEDASLDLCQSLGIDGSMYPSQDCMLTPSNSAYQEYFQRVPSRSFRPDLQTFLNKSKKQLNNGPYQFNLQ